MRKKIIINEDGAFMLEDGDALDHLPEGASVEGVLPFEATFAIRMPDGAYRWALLSGEDASRVARMMFERPAAVAEDEV